MPQPVRSAPSSIVFLPAIVAAGLAALLAAAPMVSRDAAFGGGLTRVFLLGDLAVASALVAAAALSLRQRLPGLRLIRVHDGPVRRAVAPTAMVRSTRLGPPSGPRPAA